jgi:hypothetical protein
MRHFFSLPLYLLLTTPTFALYDAVSINTVPTGNDTTFCFSQDTSPKISFDTLKLDNLMYLAATTNYTDFFFLTPTAIETEPSVQVWQLPTEPPIFSQWNKNGPVVNCLGPFDNAMLQSFKLYIGVSNSFSDLLQNQKYRQFFNGFVTLPQPPKNWTVMVYMVGSDLESRGRNGSKDLLEMLTGTTPTSSDTTNLVLTTGGSTREGWKTVKRSLIQDGQYYVLEDLGAKSMAAPQTLSDFVIWAKDHFPAQHYALILWNHGGGTGGYGKDTSEVGNGDVITLPELHQTYQTIRTQLDKPLDIVVYDACLMSSIEVAEITSTVANVMAGSAELEPAHGLNYEHLLHTIITNPPLDGISFGKVVKTGYLQQTQDKGTFQKSPITYSVLDLTQLPAFSNTLQQFATEFNQVLTTNSLLSYEMLSRGIIRAPGYPLAQTGRIVTSLSGKTGGNDAIRIDLYNVLQTVIPDFPNLKVQSDQLLSLLDQLVVSYEGNLQDRIHADDTITAKAGRMSLDITINNDNDGKAIEPAYLSVLPEAYRLLYQDLVYYDQRRRKDTSTPAGSFVNIDCSPGMTCAEAKWWELPANEVLGIEGYYGQQSGEVVNLYLVKSLYRYRALESDLDIGVDGHQACQYQLCVNETTCEDLTLTEQSDQLLADISLNNSPAILTFCQGENDTWSACSVVQQIQGIWGRADTLYPGDSVTPTTLHFQTGKLTSQAGNTLQVGEEPVTLTNSCDTFTATIIASYYGANQKRQFESLCNEGDCVCGEDDLDASCQAIHVKAGVRLKVE